MKVQILTMCLLATLAGGARAESAPVAEAPVAQPLPPAVPPTAVSTRRQALEAQRKALEDRQRELEADIQQLEEEARRIDPEGRLTPDQLFALLQAREERANGSNSAEEAVIGIFFFGSLLMGFLAWQLASYRKARQLHETVRLMVEKGAEIPSGLLSPPPRRKPSDLRRGIILSTAGLGLALFLACLPDVDGAWGAGLMLFLIGVGHLLVWRLQQGRGPLSAGLASEPQP
jgi:hypothetical protein